MANRNRQTDEIQLRDYLMAIYRRRWVIVFVFALVFGAILVKTITSPKIYQAYALIQVKEERSQNPLISDLAKLGKGRPVAAEMEILKSRTIAERVVQALHLDLYFPEMPEGMDVQMEDVEVDAERKDQLFTVRFLEDQDSFELLDADNNTLGEGKVGQPFKENGIRFNLTQAVAEPGQSFQFVQYRFLRAVVGVQATLRILEVGKDTSIIMLTYRHRKPGLARDVVNKVVEVYREANIEEKTLEASQTLEFIEKQLHLIQSNLEASEESLHKFKTERGVMLLPDEASALINNIAALEREGAHADLEIYQVEKLLEAVQEGKDLPHSYRLPSLNRDEMLLSTLSVELAEKEVQRQALLEEFTDSHPEVRAISAAIVDLKTKLEQILENTKSTLQARRSSIDDSLTEYSQQLKHLPGIEKDLAALMRTTEVNANIYKFLLETHEEARIAKAATVGNIRVIDWALTPTVPVQPKTRLNLLLGFIAGLIMALVAAFTLEYVDDSLKTLEEVERHVGQPVYGVIPRIAQDNGDADKPLSMLITKTHPKSPISEAFRTMRTNIQFADPDKSIHTILVTSAGPSEGKSTIVSNLSVTMANLGKKTLLVDCDLRKPNLHNLFDMKREPGLTDVIMGETSWKDAITKTAVDNLDVMTSGPIPPNPTELLGSRRMREFLDNAKEEYGIVLLDSPPIIAVTDAALLSSLMDGTLLVVELGLSRAHAVNRAVDLLKNVQSRLLGVVVNNLASAGSRYNYGYYSSYYYTSETGEKKNPKGRRPKRWRS